MTDFTRDWIAKREQLEQAATEGPWFQDAWDPGIVRGGDGRYWSIFESEMGHDAAAAPSDAAFIADARTSLPAALAALKAVLELHRPVEVEPSDTICGECSFQLPNGRYFGKVVEWPCSTVATIEAALWGES